MAYLNRRESSDAAAVLLPGERISNILRVRVGQNPSSAKIKKQTCRIRFILILLDFWIELWPKKNERAGWEVAIRRGYVSRRIVYQGCEPWERTRRASRIGDGDFQDAHGRHFQVAIRPFT